MDDDRVIREWCEELRIAWLLARTERLGELRGQRSKTFDDRGLHPYSHVVGRIEALQGVLPLLRELNFDPYLLRMEAKLDAESEFRKEILDEFIGRF